MVGAREEFDREEWISGRKLPARGSEMCLSGSAQGASGRVCMCVWFSMYSFCLFYQDC